MRKAFGYTTIMFGLVGIIYGFSEYMYALESVQYLLGGMIEFNPELLNDPEFQAIINIAIGQVTAMKVLTYIVPGLILVSLGVGLIFLVNIIEKLDGYSKTGNEIIQSLTGALSGEGDIIELKNEVQNTKET